MRKEALGRLDLPVGRIRKALEDHLRRRAFALFVCSSGLSKPVCSLGCNANDASGGDAAFAGDFSATCGRSPITLGISMVSSYLKTSKCKGGARSRDIMQLIGIHHLTAVSADAVGNRRFYEGILGMRLVKKTVNQDDVSAYHLFYADGLASPGTDITFFDWPVPPERRGTHSISHTALRVEGAGTLLWWQERLAEAGMKIGAVAERDGRQALDFEDPEGQRLSLVDDRGWGEANPWAESSVPPARQIRGLGPITLSVPDLAPTDAVLTALMNMRPVRTYPHPEHDADMVHVYEMGEGGPGAELHVGVQPGLPPARQGAGGVHHVAFRTPDSEYDAWAERLNRMRIPNSGKVDRYYFKSLYFREPNGILFEIASEGPGFAVDEPLETLGKHLALPPFLEPRRREIEAGLQPV